MFRYRVVPLLINYFQFIHHRSLVSQQLNSCLLASLVSNLGREIGNTGHLKGFNHFGRLATAVKTLLIDRDQGHSLLILPECSLIFIFCGTSNRRQILLTIRRLGKVEILSASDPHRCWAFHLRIVAGDPGSLLSLLFITHGH